MFIKRIQLALIHMAVAMTLVPINSTLNRVMIKELAVPATIVAILASLPYLFSPLQVAIGAFSDRHPVLGFRRSPYIVIGLLLCVIGVILAPVAIYSEPVMGPLGYGLAALAFGAWGMGFNFASVAYISLASEISGEKGRSRTISIMWFVMIAGIIVTSITLSRLLTTYTPQTLERAFVIVALAALALGLLGLIRLEPRTLAPVDGPRRASWSTLLRSVMDNRQARHFFFYLIILLAAILGQDVLLEPYAAQAFHLPVEATTRITSIWGGCMLASLLAAGWLERFMSRRTMVKVGAVGAALAFLIIAGSGPLGMKSVFYSGVLVLGLATGLSTVSNLSLMMDMTTSRVGLFIGAWGVADALARLVGTVMGGVLRDAAAHLTGNLTASYSVVFVLEAAMLAVSLVMLARIDVGRFRRDAESLTITDRAAVLNEISN